MRGPGSSELLASGGRRGRSPFRPHGIAHTRNHDLEALRGTEAGGPPLNRIVDVRERIAGHKACAPKQRDLEAQTSARPCEESAALLEQRTGSCGFEGQHFAQCGAVLSPQHLVGIDGEARQIFGREIDPASPCVLGDVLPMVYELKAGADLIGGLEQSWIVHPEEIQHETTHWVGGVAAVLQQLLPGRIALLYGVAPKRSEQRAEQIEGQPKLADHCAACALREMGCRPTVGRSFESAFPFGERDPGIHARLGLIREVIGDADGGVDRRERAPHPARQQERPHGKVLVVGARQPGAGAQVLLERRVQRRSDGDEPHPSGRAGLRARSRR